MYMIRYGVWIFLGVVAMMPVYGYEWFSHTGASDYQELTRDCNLNQRASCIADHQQTRDKVEPFLDLLWSMVEHSGYQQEKLINSLESVLPWLESKRESVGDDESKFFMIDVLIIGFTDILNQHELNQNSLYLSSQLIQETVTTDIIWRPVYSEIRQSLVRQLMQRGFDRFVSQPYAYGLDILTTGTPDRQTRSLQQNILHQDALDRVIGEFLQKEGDEEGDLWISPEVYKERESIYLFQTASDLDALRYQVVSHRTRINTDAEYRRYNIAKAFEEIGHLRVLNPGEKISFLGDSNFDRAEKQNYKVGKAIFLDEEVDTYGGGLCGGSTAIYQGTFLNKSLEFAKRNHSKWYSSLYTATINGEEQTIPGIDSTIYSPNLDLHITNTADYPIIVVMNYDGWYESVEEVFTMSPTLSDQWSYGFIQSWNRWYTLQQQDREPRSVVGKCYEWEIKGELSTRCYKEVF